MNALNEKLSCTRTQFSASEAPGRDVKGEGGAGGGDGSGGAHRNGVDDAVADRVLRGPALRQRDRRAGVDQAEAVVVGDLQPAAVPVHRRIDMPAGAAGIGLAGGVGEDLLHVADAETRVGLQHQCDHAGDEGGCERRPVEPEIQVAVGEVAAADDGVGQDAGARRADQHARAGRGVAAVRRVHRAVGVEGRDRHDIDAALEGMQVGVVARLEPVAGGEHVDGAEPAAPDRRCGQHRLERPLVVRIEHRIGEGRAVAPTVVGHVEVGGVEQGGLGRAPRIDAVGARAEDAVGGDACAEGDPR
ncbi:MAG: hypothetical protein WDN25_07890 [Acetobacteraceae bacterium]